MNEQLIVHPKRVLFRLSAFKVLLLLALCFCIAPSYGQQVIKDQAVDNQQQRMVFLQWNQNAFYPKPGFLSLNPYYWLVWGLFYPNYHNTDLRPLSATGPQTQRLALVAAQTNSDNNYKLHSDTLRNTAISQIAATSGLLSDADPLWILFYDQQFRPLLNYSTASLLGGLPPEVSAKLLSEGTFNWYTSQLASLKQRLQGARTSDMDRSSRIMAYYRLLNEYQALSGVWAIRTATAAKDIKMTADRNQLKAGQVVVAGWTPQTDVQIANQVLKHANL